MEKSDIIRMWNDKRVEKMRKKLSNYDNDVDKEKRIKKCECKYCYYINIDRISMSALTKSNCFNCEKEMTFASSDVDIYCEECAKLLNVCKHCSAEMD